MKIEEKMRGKGKIGRKKKREKQKRAARRWNGGNCWRPRSIITS